MGNLELRAFATQNGKILTPVELERLTRAKREGHEGATPCRLLLSLPIGSPVTRKSRDTAVGPLKAENHKIGMHLFQRATLLARLGRLRLQPAGQLLRERIELTMTLRRRELRLDRACVQLLLDRVARQSGPPRNLAERQLLPQRHASDDVQKSHVYHSNVPRCAWRWGKGHMGQFSMEIRRLPGSLLGGNQHEGLRR